jgi:hypothetical protein
MNPEKLAAAVGVPLNTVGGAYYFHPRSVTRSKELGLDGFRFYVLGRGGVLGDVEAPVIQSAFGWFNGGLIAKMWDSARSVVSPRQAARELLDCGHAIGRAGSAISMDSTRSMRPPKPSSPPLTRPAWRSTLVTPPSRSQTMPLPERCGWEESPVIEEHHRRSLDQAEELTNKISSHGFAGLTAEQGDALLAGANGMLAALQDD